jgi:hypothetical protein
VLPTGRVPAERGPALSLSPDAHAALMEHLFDCYLEQITCLRISTFDAMARSISSGSGGICHRGALDPLAHWLDRGWAEDAFFEYTRTAREAHYARDQAVIHLVTAADGAVEF